MLSKRSSMSRDKSCSMTVHRGSDLIWLSSMPPRGSHEGAHLGFLKTAGGSQEGGCWEGTCLHPSAQQRHPMNLHTRDISSVLYPFLCPLPSQGITLSSKRADSPPSFTESEKHIRLGNSPAAPQSLASWRPVGHASKDLMIMVWLVQGAC